MRQLIPGAIPTRADRTRDVLAAVALLVSAALEWNADTVGAGRIDVVAVTALSVLSLVLPAASRRGVFGPRWTPARLRLAKVLLGVPYLVLVAVYLGWDVMSRWTGWDYGSTGLGPAVWIGFAGAVLAAQPRECELFDVVDVRPTRALARTVLAVIGGLFAVSALSAVATALYRFVDGIDAVAGVRMGVLDPLVSALIALCWLAIVGQLVAATVAGRVGGALCLTLLGWAAATWALLVSIPGAPFDSLDTVQLGYLGIGVLGGLGAAAASPALAAPPAMTQRDYYLPPLRLVLVVSTLWVAVSVVRLTLYSASVATLAALVFFTAAVAGATYVRERLSDGDAEHRGVLLSVAAMLIAIGIAVLVTMGVRVNWNYPAPMALWLTGFVVPALILWREVLAPGLRPPHESAFPPDGFIDWAAQGPGAHTGGTNR
ncbi:hypothetical protein DFR67_12150 [Williamsia limnetica]|uniref:DUF7937 domain-containing protein n=1 Tax=Williamsia limnetica TaxID=882452 RepID=A0A318RH37_WILLI|nr:hypothetical protein [Williamsia limnetica]PYE12620.1 hypothetical protein DFR67_12150 [Williamsia limnetica]